MSYIFKKTDGGKASDSDSVRRKHGNDCMVRALAIATDIPYPRVYDELVEMDVFKPGRAGFMDRFVGQLHWEEKDFHGFKFVWHPFPAKKGLPRMNADTFAAQFPKGTFILRMGHHVCTMIDTVLHDSFVHTDMRCVYGAWELIMLHAELQYDGRLCEEILKGDGK